VPHLSRLHEIPHDYYRYTEYGLRYLLQSNELEPVSIQVRGGLFSFLGHQAATVLLGMAWGSQGAAALVRWLNRYLLTYPCYWLDQVGAQASLFPLGYVVVARRQARQQKQIPASRTGDAP
jgi:hypothetical protein